MRYDEAEDLLKLLKKQRTSKAVDRDVSIWLVALSLAVEWLIQRILNGWYSEE